MGRDCSNIISLLEDRKGLEEEEKEKERKKKAQYIFLKNTKLSGKKKPKYIINYNKHECIKLAIIEQNFSEENYQKFNCMLFIRVT